MSAQDRMNPGDEQLWLDEQEALCVTYLLKEGLDVDFDVRLEIQWCLAPKVSLWSLSADDRRLWVIAGDLPTDRLDDPDVDDPRTAVRALCRRWIEIAAELRAGRQHAAIKMSPEPTPQQAVELGDLLLRRATVLQRWTDDDAIWASGLA